MSEPPLMSRFLDSLKSKVITITVGGDAKEYQVPEGVLRSASPWFEKALKDDRFEEGRTSTIALPEDPPSAFEVFVYYAYHQNIAFDRSRSRDPEARSKDLFLLFEVWTFADKYLVPGLQNSAMHVICLLLNDKFWKATPLEADTLAACWNASNSGTPLRLVIADYLVDRMQRNKDFEMPNCSGLVQEFNASWQTYYDIKNKSNDFPRFLKPTKFSALLHVGVSSSTADGYDSQWDKPRDECEECGFCDKNMDLICRLCRGDGCYCDEVFVSKCIRICPDCL